MVTARRVKSGRIGSFFLLILPPTGCQLQAPPLLNVFSSVLRDSTPHSVHLSIHRSVGGSLSLSLSLSLIFNLYWNTLIYFEHHQMLRTLGDSIQGCSLKFAVYIVTEQCVFASVCLCFNVSASVGLCFSVPLLQSVFASVCLCFSGSFSTGPKISVFYPISPSPIRFLGSPVERSDI